MLLTGLSVRAGVSASRNVATSSRFLFAKEEHVVRVPKVLKDLLQGFVPPDFLLRPRKKR